ncbi:hypothetical protein HYALB_00005193 [Hymenoscyphus albidus]|uniref:galacturonan 1,4-alpha-galacturonidase n=1 Tax=Hymenoscyphus albidus TaxID=595503 RepID=A0A9N9LX17_9HELO|nr:hypothetical protein HYALB_00005193 [Hymenoscyphus albidus]
MHRLSLLSLAILPFLTQTHAQAQLQNPLPPIKDPQGKTCIVHALRNQTDDAPQILKAFETCNHGGVVDEVYWIATRLNPVVEDVEVRWRGVWVFSDDLDYWRTNSYPITFQNHATNFILTGTRIAINGYGIGGINGNGNAWYNAEEAVTRVGRPMPFNLWNYILKESKKLSLNRLLKTRGEVTNLLFENFLIHGSNAGPSITQNNGNNGSFAGTSKMQISDVTFRNFHRYTQGGKGNQTASVSCSRVHPCYGIAFDDVRLASAPNASEIAPQGRCEYVADKGVVGLAGAGC